MNEFTKYINEKIFGGKSTIEEETLKPCENIIKTFPEVNTHEDKYIQRLFRHKALVYYFGRKLNKYYLDHDNDKLDPDMFHGYALTMKEHRNPSEQALLDQVTLKHIRSNKHHPEYWTRTDLTGFSRNAFTPNGIIDARFMPVENIKEMCCDWCAVAFEKGNTPQEWANKVINHRWKFNNGQIKIINETLELLWGKENV